jgi:DNA repair protein RadD
MQLREYQISAIDKIRASMRSGKKSIILQASCGAGKTIISGEIVNSAIEKGKRVLFLVNRRDLVYQTVEKYCQFGIGEEVGVILAGEDSHLGRPIQCATLQTYGRRLKLEEITSNKWFHDADLLIYDECHSANAPTYNEIVKIYRESGKYIIGLSATPMGARGTGLSDTFEEIIECVPMNELIKDGFLVPAVHFAPHKPDLTGVGDIGNDYNQKQLGKAVDKPKLIGEILENWLNIACGRKTIIFATNVKHSKHLRDKFSNNGISIAHIDSHTNDEDRKKVYNDFEHGDLQIITNVGVACEGSDLPICSCICVAKPTKVLSRWLQMAGRGARPYPGKDNYYILDFSGCIDQHGYVDDPVEWSLDGKKLAATKKIIRKKEKTLITCDMCKHVFTGRECPNCHFIIPDWGKRIEEIPADLVEVGKGKSKEKKLTTEQKQTWYAMFDYERRRLGKTEKWLLAQYKSKTGVWPRNMDNIRPVEPNDECRNWLTSQRIRYAKSRKAQNAQA